MSKVPIRTAEMQRIEARLGQPIDETLRKLYVDRGLTVRQVGSELGVTAGVVSRWLERFGIPARKPGQRAEVA